MIYPKHTPEIIKPLAKDMVFNLPNDASKIYLTFDDGPHTSITPWVLDQLKEHEAKATFFLIGKNAVNHPSIVARIIEEGHSIGNHTYSHLNGWKTADDAYIADIEKCATLVNSNILRPPYGKITLSQARKLKAKFRIIQWSDLSADFDDKYKPENCLRFATNKIKAGSIIVFHDSLKAWPRLETMLPLALKHYKDKGFKMSALNSD